MNDFETPDTRPVELLLVEDNEDDVVLVREALQDSKLLNLLRVVKNGEEALAYLRGEPPYAEAGEPGLVLMDINMPRMNGLEALEVIKGDARLRHIPVVMLTVSDREEDVLRSFQAGAVSYIRKPVDFEGLRRAIEKFEVYWTLVSKLPRRGR